MRSAILVTLLAGQSTTTMINPHSIARAWRTAALPVGVLLIGWTLSARLYVWMERDRVHYNDARRESMIAGVETDLQIRLAMYENALRFAAADLAISDHLANRENWHILAEHLALFNLYPGTESISIIRPVPSSKLAAFAAMERARGWGEIQVRPMTGAQPPLSPSAEHIVLAAMEPPQIATRAVGVDLAVDPRRKLAAEQARDSGLPVLAGNLRLGNNISGLQLFLPVYHNGASLETVDARRAALTGWVSVTFSANPFFRSAMRDRASFVNLRVFDGAASPENLVFTSSPGAAPAAGERSSTLSLDGTSWLLEWSRNAEFPLLSKAPSVWAAGSCALTAMLLSALVFKLHSKVQWAQSRLAIEEKQAQQARAFLASLVQSSDDSVVGTTLDGTIASWNAASERLWGYTAEEVTGKSITIIFRPGHKQDYLDALDKIKQNRQALRYESWRVRRDGSLVEVSVIVSPIIDHSGELIGTSATYRDVTDRKRAESELCRAKEAAESASRAKSEFLANMSHELRTPMNGVLGMVDILLETEVNAEQREYLTIAKDSGNALLDVINDILDFSKIEAGKLDLHLCEFIPGEHLESLLKPFRVNARQKGLKLVCDIDPSVPSLVLGDPVRIRQVLVNLLGNAIKFTSRGEVGLSAKARRSGIAGGWQLLFTVWDTGIGISRQKQKIIFEAFTQEDGSTTRRYGGTGLGLAISKRLADLMGGEIRVESAPDQGATFWFAVPVDAVPDSDAQPPGALSVWDFSPGQPGAAPFQYAAALTSEPAAKASAPPH